MPVLLGIILGLSTLLFIGPVFFYLLKSSLESGFKAGTAVAIGIILGDIICVFLAFFEFHSFFETPENLKWITLVGCILLLFFGITYVLNPYLKEPKKKSSKPNNLFVFFINGFLINFVNPFVFGVWFGFYALNASRFVSKNLIILSLVITLLVIFITDILKAYFAQKLLLLLKPEKLKIIFRIFGIIMIGFAMRLFILFLSF